MAFAQNRRTTRPCTRLNPWTIRTYALVTGAYWAFTVTDGALRMLALLYFHDLGYSPISLAMLFLLYELFGVFTNLIGGWIGACYGLRHTLTAGPRVAGCRASGAVVAPAKLAGMGCCCLGDGCPGVVGHRQGPHQADVKNGSEARGW